MNEIEIALRNIKAAMKERTTDYEDREVVTALLHAAAQGLQKADMAEENKRLRAENERLKREVDRYSNRDGNATIELCKPTDDNPFNSVELTHVNFGVADNIYVVEEPKS